MCTIDASKAFDRVNLFVLFNLLRNRNFCLLYLRFLMYSYCNQRMRVRWNSSNSREFLLSNGVKQGGVLSPFKRIRQIDVKIHNTYHKLRCHCVNTSYCVNMHV